MISEELGKQEGYRYIIKRGKFGMYFWDTEEKKKMPLAEVCRLLNEYYNDYISDHVVCDVNDAEMIAGGWKKVIIDDEVDNKQIVSEYLGSTTDNIGITEKYVYYTPEELEFQRQKLLEKIERQKEQEMNNFACPVCKVVIDVSHLGGNVGIFLSCRNCFSELVLKENNIGLRE